MSNHISDMDERLQAFKHLLDIVDEVRAKCPWDSVQTIESIRHLTIEETYELSEAILANDLPDVKKELGDLMLHITLYSKWRMKKAHSILLMCLMASVKR